jgi:hypothetical protein
MFGRAEMAQEFHEELRLWEQVNQRRDAVLAELTSRVATQAERDNSLLRKLEATRARLAQAILREAQMPQGLAFA